MIGTTISHYRILEELGRGGMGVVYKAEDITLKRVVALKFLPPHVAASDTDKARFLLEAQAAAALNHPNICTIYGIEEEAGQAFIAMEFIDGQTLREKRGTINLGKAIEIGIQIADGLAIAHEKGVVHRDIKPENVMVRKDGIVQIMDFGLAKLRASRASRLTKEGSTVGTAGFMSPEQVQGQDTDHRSDIFSLGVLLYELFSGELPFKGVHETALLYEIVNVDPAPMSSVKPEIDPELDRIVLECMQKEPDERYQGVKDISKDLKRFKRESGKAKMSRTYSVQTAQQLGTTKPMGAGAERPLSEKRFSATLKWQAIAFIAVAAFIVFFLQSRKQTERPPGPVTRSTMKLPEGALIPIGFAGLNISPDGKFMSFVVATKSGARTALRSSDREAIETVLSSDVSLIGNTYSAFSPDGQWIAYTAGNTIRKASVFGGASVTIADLGSGPRGVWWGSEKNIYLGSISSSIYRVSESGGAMVPVTTLDSSAGEISHRFPELLPGGTSMLFTIKFGTITSFDEAAIAVLDTKSGEKKVLIRGGTYARYVPTGHLLFVRGSFIYAVPFNLAKLEIVGQPKQLFRGGWMNPFSGDASIAFSNDGTLLYVPRGIEAYAVGGIKWIDMHGNITSLVDSTGSYFSGAISPDNQKIALHVQGANDDVWLYHVGRKSMTRLTFGGGNSGLPVWSPDGKYLVYASERGKGQQIFRKLWDGSGKEERLTSSERSQEPRSISPDGKLLAFIQDGDIWLLSLDGSGTSVPFFESAFTESNPVFSPDGKYLAYESNESGKQEVVIVPFPSRGGKWQISAGGGVNPIWSPSGAEIYFTQGGSIFAVTVHAGPAFDYSAPRKMFDIPPDGANLVGISSDGKRFAMVMVPYAELNTSEVTLVINWFQELTNAFAGK